MSRRRIKMSDQDIQKMLAEFEARYGMVSSEFYEKYNAGQMGDDHDLVVWAGMYEVLLIKRQATANR